MYSSSGGETGYIPLSGSDSEPPQSSGVQSGEASSNPTRSNRVRAFLKRIFSSRKSSPADTATAGTSASGDPGGPTTEITYNAETLETLHQAIYSGLDSTSGKDSAWEIAHAVVTGNRSSLSEHRRFEGSSIPSLNALRYVQAIHSTGLAEGRQEHLSTIQTHSINLSNTRRKPTRDTSVRKATEALIRSAVVGKPNGRTAAGRYMLAMKAKTDSEGVKSAALW